jgi:hypothetical protein
MWGGARRRDPGRSARWLPDLRRLASDFDEHRNHTLATTTNPPPNSITLPETPPTARAAEAAEPRLVFETAYGGEGEERGVAVVETSDGGFLAVGVAVTETAGDEVLLIRTDRSGRELWSLTHGGPGDQAGWSAVATGDGGFVVAGFTEGPETEGVDVLVLGVDETGELLWERTYGGAFDDYGWAVTAADGLFLVAGETASTGAGGIDGYLLAVDGDGEEMWSANYGGVRNDRLFSIVPVDGGYVLGGITFSSGAGGRDAYVVGVDLEGAVIWERTFGDVGDDVSHSVDVTDDGGVIAAGYTDGFGARGYEPYLIRLDAGGETVWTTTIPLSGDHRAIGVRAAPDGGYLLAGYASGPDLRGEDAEVIKTDASGVPVWIATFGGATNDIGYGATITAGGDYVVVGHVSNGGESTRDVLLVRLVDP